MCDSVIFVTLTLTLVLKIENRSKMKNKNKIKWKREIKIKSTFSDLDMSPIWEPLLNSPQCLKLHIYTRYPWNKTRHSCSKQIPWENRCIHQEWDRSTQMEATYYWRLPSCQTQYGRPWGWLRIALEPTHHIKPQKPLLHHCCGNHLS